MHFSSITLKNHKSFWNETEVPLEKGINFLVGPNNSGKTAILRRLELAEDAEHHRSPESLPNKGDSHLDEPSIQTSLEVERSELIQILSRGTFHLAASGGSGGSNLGRSFETWLEAKEVVEFVLTGARADTLVNLSSLGYHGDLKEEQDELTFGSQGQHSRYRLRSRAPRLQHEHSGHGSINRHFVQKIRDTLRDSRNYRFDAVRPIGAKTDVTEPNELRKDASNLAVCIQNLGGESKYSKLNELIRRVFPDVYEVVSSPQGNKQTRIDIRKFPDRPDLDIPLSECGSGLGQVLAILYLLVTSTTSRIILIDEPASFLHPDAARALMQILREYADQHQFIIATHSPVILSAVPDASIVYVGIEDGVSYTEQIDPADNRHLQQVLGGLGARLSDLFGAENIIWVEGETEEQCFPLIIEEMFGGMPYGTTLRQVLHTGDLDGSDAERVYRIYQNLSEGRALLPRAVAYVFDREDKTEKEIEDLERRANAGTGGEDNLFFLDARMYENYILDAEALHHAIRENAFVPDDVSEGIALEDVQPRLDDVLEARWKDFCDDEGIDDPTDEKRRQRWRKKDLHAADAIAEVLAEWKLNHRKPVYGRLMTEWLLENEPDRLQPLADQIEAIFERVDEPAEGDA